MGRVAPFWLRTVVAGVLPAKAGLWGRAAVAGAPFLLGLAKILIKSGSPVRRPAQAISAVFPFSKTFLNRYN